MSLDALQAELLRLGIAASLRAGRAEFLFAERQGRAIELSAHQGQWWVEFWDRGIDESRSPVKDEFFPSAVEAIHAICLWLV